MALCLFSLMYAAEHSECETYNVIASLCYFVFL